MSIVTSLNTKNSATIAKHVHLTTDLIQSIQNSLKNNYEEFDEAEGTVCVQFYGFIHLSNNPVEDFLTLMNNLNPVFGYSSFNGIIVYNIKTKTLSADLDLDNYWLDDESQYDFTELRFSELNPSLYIEELEKHTNAELADENLLNLFVHSRYSLADAL